MGEKYHTVGTIPKSYIKVVERCKIDTSNTQTHNLAWHRHFNKKWRGWTNFMVPNLFNFIPAPIIWLLVLQYHSNDIIIIPVVVLTTIHKNIDLIHQMAIYALIFLCGSRHKKFKRLTHILPTLDIWHSKWYVSKNALTLKWSCIIQDVRYTHDISLQLIFFCHWKSADIKCLFPKLSRK